MKASFSDMIARFAKQYDIPLEEGFDIVRPGEVLDIEVEGLVLYIEAAPALDALLLHTAVFSEPDGVTDPMRRELLAANCFFQGTGGITLGSTEDTVIVQALFFYSDVPPELFGLLIHRIVEIALYWKNRLQHPESWSQLSEEKPELPKDGGMTANVKFIRG